MPKFWVLQTAFLGDCVLSLPFLYRLSQHFPDSEMRWIVTPGTRGIFELALERGLSAAAAQVELLSFDKKGQHKNFLATWRFVSEQKRTFTPEVAFCLQRSFRTALLAMLSGAEERIGFSSGSAAFLYTQAVARDWHHGRHEIEKNLDLLRAFTGEEIPAWDRKAAPSLLRNEKLTPLKSDEAPVAIAVGSPWATKRWPIENAAELVQRLTQEGQRVILLGDPASVSLGEQLEKLAPSLLVQNFVGKTTLREWVDLIQNSKVLVANDSAAVHVASDLNIPVVALFGPTLPDFGFAPFRPGSKVLGLSELPCRPCDIHGPKTCPLGHHRCLKDIHGSAVHEQLAPWLKP